MFQQKKKKQIKLTNILQWKIIIPAKLNSAELDSFQISEPTPLVLMI